MLIINCLCNLSESEHESVICTSATPNIFTVIAYLCAVQPETRDQQEKSRDHSVMIGVACIRVVFS